MEFTKMDVMDECKSMDRMDEVDDVKEKIYLSIQSIVSFSLSAFPFQNRIDGAVDLLVHRADAVVQFVQAHEERFFV